MWKKRDFKDSKPVGLRLSAGLSLLEALLFVVILIVSAQVFSSFVVSERSIGKQFQHSVNGAVVFSRFFDIINDVDTHSYKLLPVVIRQSQVPSQLRGLDLKIGVQYLKISTHLVFKRQRDSSRFCPRGEEIGQITSFLGVGLDGLCVFATTEKIYLPVFQCRNFDLIPHPKSLLACETSANRVILLHPIKKLYLLWIDSSGSLRFTSFDSINILENQLVLENSKIKDISVEYKKDLQSVKILVTGTGLHEVFYSSIPRKDHRQLLLDPLL